MNQTSVVRVLSAIAQNPSSFVAPKEIPVNFKHVLYIAVGTVNGAEIVLNIGSREKIKAEASHATRYTQTVNLIPIAKHFACFCAASAELRELLTENNIELFEMASLFGNSSVRDTLIQQQIQEFQSVSVGRVQHPIINILQEMGMLGGEESLFEDCGECDACMKGTNGPMTINWDEPVFNALGEVKYSRRENDSDSGYRQIKAIIDGQSFSYPVDTETGAPLMPGLDHELYAVFNKTAEPEAEQVSDEADLSSVIAYQMLNDLFPGKQDEIKQIVDKLAA